MTKNKQYNNTTQTAEQEANEPQILEFSERKKWIHQGEEEISNKSKVISLFSGSGGLDLGF